MAYCIVFNILFYISEIYKYKICIIKIILIFANLKLLDNEKNTIYDFLNISDCLSFEPHKTAVVLLRISHI